MTKRGRPSLSADKVRTIQYLRHFCDLTILEIARATNISISSVNRYSRFLPNSRRHGNLLIFSPKTGIVGTHYMPKVVRHNNIINKAAGRKAS